VPQQSLQSTVRTRLGRRFRITSHEQQTSQVERVKVHVSKLHNLQERLTRPVRAVIWSKESRPQYPKYVGETWLASNTGSLQKFSIIQILLSSVQLLIANRRPSGEGIA
jgi:hypothetical protein